MRSIRIWGMFFLSVIVKTGWTQEAAAVLHRVVERLSPVASRALFVYDNPAFMYDRWDSSYIAVSLSGGYSHESRARILQEGKGESGFGFQARSWYRLNEKSRTWGEAEYRNGKRDDVQWNETSDFRVVYPYVMADTTGGDLKTETYRFQGGYAREYPKWSWGGVLAYRAMMDYRKRDPRPRNVVSDVNADVGMIWKAGKHYAVGAALSVRKYKQTNQVKFFSETGTYKIYHLTGLGTDYVRFAGATSNAYYKGRAYGGNVNIYPRNRQGFTGSVGYKRLTFDKILPDFNDLPLVSVTEEEGGAELAWLGRRKGHSWLLQLRGKMKKRMGTEYLFGDPAGNAYPQIGKVSSFRNRRVFFEVSGIYEDKRNDCFQWGIMPLLSYEQVKTEYFSSYRRMEWEEMAGEMRVFSSFITGQSLWHVRMACRRYQNLNSAWVVVAGTTEEPGDRLTEENYVMLSAHRTMVEGSARWDYSGWFSGKALFMEGRWWYEWRYSGEYAGGVSVALGIVF